MFSIYQKHTFFMGIISVNPHKNSINKVDIFIYQFKKYDINNKLYY